MRKLLFLLVACLCLSLSGFSRKPKSKAKQKPFLPQACLCWGYPSYYDMWVGDQYISGWITPQYSYMAGNGESCTSASINLNIYSFGGIWFYSEGELVGIYYVSSGMQGILACNNIA